MMPITSGQLQRARKARQALAARFLGDPAVRMIDIGKVGGAIAVRIHVDPHAPPSARAAFPDRVNGVPVIVVAADFQPE
ncbi:MAG: hypothetical protein IT496_04020 [Gammaproteobacteria bacterium]|nr:hypothetical protein [Gammaproteobacteria bacterium]MCG3143436.1 hypothetical protein [Gammaproteobacteria bacterium]